MRLRRADLFGDLADNPTADFAGHLLVDLTDTEIGRGRERLDLGDEVRWDGRPAQMSASCEIRRKPATNSDLMSAAIPK